MKDCCPNYHSENSLKSEVDKKYVDLFDNADIVHSENNGIARITAKDIDAVLAYLYPHRISHHSILSPIISAALLLFPLSALAENEKNGYNIRNPLEKTNQLEKDGA